jgi:hypothetical protein
MIREGSNSSGPEQYIRDFIIIIGCPGLFAFSGLREATILCLCLVVVELDVQRVVSGLLCLGLGAGHYSGEREERT